MQNNSYKLLVLTLLSSTAYAANLLPQNSSSLNDYLSSSKHIYTQKKIGGKTLHYRKKKDDYDQPKLPSHVKLLKAVEVDKNGKQKILYNIEENNESQSNSNQYANFAHQPFIGGDNLSNNVLLQDEKVKFDAKNSNNFPVESDKKKYIIKSPNVKGKINYNRCRIGNKFYDPTKPYKNNQQFIIQIVNNNYISFVPYNDKKNKPINHTKENHSSSVNLPCLKLEPHSHHFVHPNMDEIDEFFNKIKN